MKIVHVVRQFHPAVGGLETVVMELVRVQASQGHSVRVVTLNRIFNSPDHADLPERETVAGAEVIRIPFRGSTRYPIAPTVIRHIHDADVVHVHAIDFFFDFLAWTKPIHRRCLVASTHGGYFHSRRAIFLKRLYFATVTRASLTFYSGVAAVSRFDYDSFRTKRRRGIACIENGVDVSKYLDASSPAPRKSIISIGRFSTNKRLERLLAFMDALHRRDPEWRLKILGRPWDLKPSDLQALIRRYQLEEVVEIQVLPSDAEIRFAMADCSLVACASEYEGFGIAPIEGLAAGLFPILHDIPPFREVVGRTGIGLVVDFSDPGLAAGTLLEQWPAIRMRYVEQRRAAMTAARQFDWSKVAQAYWQLYEAALGTRIRSILQVPVHVETVTGAFNLLDSLFEREQPSIVAFANAHTLNVAATDASFHVLLRRCVVFNDGLGVDIASRVLYGAGFPDNLNGTDFTPRYLRESRHRFRIFLLGSKPGVARRAARRLAQLCPQHELVGQHSGFFSPEEGAQLPELIRASRANIILVGMGNPVQELWLDRNIAATGCRLGFAIGGLLDFLGEEKPRAAPWIRSARLEWLYRLALEPRRLTRRYLFGIPAFLLRIMGQWGSGARIPG